MYMYIYIYLLTTKQKTKVQAIFLNLFTICLSYKWKFVVCPFFMKKQTEVINLRTD